MDSLIPPTPPTQVRATNRDHFIELSWQGTGADIDTQYIIYRRMKGGEAWQIIAYIPIQGNNSGEFSYQDYEIEVDTIYEYAITAVDRYKNESDFSDIVENDSDS